MSIVYNPSFNIGVSNQPNVSATAVKHPRTWAEITKSGIPPTPVNNPKPLPKVISNPLNSNVAVKPTWAEITKSCSAKSYSTNTASAPKLKTINNLHLLSVNSPVCWGDIV